MRTKHLLAFTLAALTAADAGAQNALSRGENHHRRVLQRAHEVEPVCDIAGLLPEGAFSPTAEERYAADVLCIALTLGCSWAALRLFATFASSQRLSARCAPW